MSYPHVPFPINVTLSSPLFQLSPIAFNSSSGWTPSCMSSACASHATWSTSLINSTLELTFWGWDAALDGSIQGDMDIEFMLDGQEMASDPSSNTLLSVRALDIWHQHCISLKILNASADALLTVNQARVNGSTFADLIIVTDRWTLYSDDHAFSYTGFVQQTSAADSVSPTTHVSSAAGDKVYLEFNGSAVVIYGPCGPSSGLMGVTLDTRRTTINTSKPIQADDCLLFQSQGMPALYLHHLEINNEDGRELGINRMEFIRIVNFGQNGNAGHRAGTAAGAIFGLFMMIVLLLSVCLMRSVKRRQKMKKLIAPLWF